MQFGPGTQGSTLTTQSPTEALQAAATASGINPSDALAFAQSTGTDPITAAQLMPGLSAYLTANPGATLGQAAANTGNATPDQASTTDKVAAEKKGGTASQSGLITDIFGDVIEVVYPWLMFVVAQGLLVFGLLLLVVALVKSPVGDIGLGFAGPVGKGIGLIGKGL